jgi:uncharacterized lipoprotein YmbA
MKVVHPIAWLVFAYGVAACGSSPPSTFYALSPTAGSSQPAPVRTLKLRRPTIAGYLERPEIVQRIDDSHRLGVADTERWAAPLDEMLGRVLAQDVEQRLPGSVVFAEDAAITADADVTIEVDVRGFDVSDGREVSLRVEVALEKDGSHNPLAVRSFELRKKLPDGTTAALVGTMSDLLGLLADQVAAMAKTVS